MTRRPASGWWACLRALPARLLVGAVRCYQLVVSPWFGPTCRFYPSCSAYAVEALRRHGALRGGWLAVRRLGRCHPWNPGGVDHVPQRAPGRDARAVAATPQNRVPHAGDRHEDSTSARPTRAA